MYRSYAELGSQENNNQDAFNVTEIMDDTHKKQILASNQVVCVNVYADWCGPCKQTASTYSILSQTFFKAGQCVMVKENYQKGLTKVESLPTYFFFVNGQVVDKLVGADMESLENIMKRLVTSNNVQNVDGAYYASTNMENNNSNASTYRNTIRNYQGGRNYN